MTRRDARTTAFALLFEWSFKPEDSLEDIIANAVQGRELQVDDFARSLCSKTMEHVEELDKLIGSYSDRWKVNRLSKVTLASLRLALCELSMFDDIPAGATINEAVELVKTYGTEDEAAYVNGILGTYARQKAAPGQEE